MLDSPVPDGSADDVLPDFTVAIHPHRGQVVVAPSGEMDLTTVGGVEREVADLRAAGFDDIVVDLRAVTFLDSSGLHLLLTETRKAKHDGYRFRLLGAPPAARRLFEITGTRGVFEFIEGSPA
jgi:anti-sigma B factor antagonist